MYRSKKTYYYLLEIKRVISFVFVLFIVAKPVVNTFSVFTDDLYELVDTDSKENSEEKKSVEDIGDEKLHFYISHFDLTYVKEEKSTVKFNFQAYHLNYYLDVFLPPPEFL